MLLIIKVEVGPLLLKLQLLIFMNNKTLSYVGIAIAVIALLISFGTFGGSKGSSHSNAVLDRVTSSGTLRIGYIIAAPYLTKDPQTGQFSGIFYDLGTAIGKQLGVKVEWVEEAGFGTIPTSLSADRYDLYAGVWMNSDRAKAMSFADAVYYDAVYAYARPSDHRFDNNLNALNSSETKISSQDGELGDTIARETFPNAQRISLPQTAPFDQLMLQVTSNKADIVFISPTVAGEFLKSNPGALRKVSETPVRIYPATFGVKLGESAFQQLINVTLQGLGSSGEIDKILNQYDPSALRVAVPYKK